MGATWSPARRTIRCAFGTWRQAKPKSRFRAISHGSVPWQSHPMGATWCPAPATTRCAFGTWRQAKPKRRSKATHALEMFATLQSWSVLLLCLRFGTISNDPHHRNLFRFEHRHRHPVAHRLGTGEIHPARHQRGRVAGRVKRLVEETLQRRSTSERVAGSQKQRTNAEKKSLSLKLIVKSALPSHTAPVG